MAARPDAPAATVMMGGSMPAVPLHTSQPATDDDLLVSVEEIAAVRARGDQPSDGGSTGKSDGND